MSVRLLLPWTLDDRHAAATYLGCSCLELAVCYQCFERKVESVAERDGSAGSKRRSMLEQMRKTGESSGRES